MKLSKRLLALTAALLLLFSLAACGENEEAPRVAETVAYDGAPITIARSFSAADFGLVKLLDSGDYTFAKTDGVSGTFDADLAVMPLWRAAQLAQNDTLQILALNTFGLFSVVTNGETVVGVKDLDGKTVSVAQVNYPSMESLSVAGSQADVLLQNLLDQRGVKATLESDSVENVYDRIVSGKAQIAVLPEPYASLAAAKGSAEVAFTLTNAWADSGEKLPLAENCIVAKTSFLENNPAGAQKFLSDLRTSVEWVNLHPTDAVNLLVEKDMVSADVLYVDPEISERKQETAKTQQAVDLIARANVVVIEGASMIEIANQQYFLRSAEPGTLPDSVFYIGK